MRILYFHQHFSTPDGSTGTRSYEMARALINGGHSVIMVCGSYKGGKTGLSNEFKRGFRRGLVDGIDVIELELKYSNHDVFLKRVIVFLKFALRSIWIALKEPSDLVFATSTPLTAGLPGIFAKWVKRKRFIFEVRDLWPELPREMGVISNPIILSLMSALEWLSYNSADACIGLSPGIVDGIKKRSKENLEVAMIPNGSDLHLFNDPDIVALRPPGCSEGDFVAIFTGSHGIANGLKAVLQAAQELKKQNIDEIKLVFIGDGKLKPELVKYAQDSGLDNCIFLEPVAKKELVKYLKGSDLGLMILDDIPAFYYGTSPNKFFDYLAASLPILVNYPGWLADLINEYKLGVSVEPKDPKLFAAAIKEMLIDKNNAKVKRNNALNLAIDKFDRTKLAQEFISFLENQTS